MHHDLLPVAVEDDTGDTPLRVLDEPPSNAGWPVVGVVERHEPRVHDLGRVSLRCRVHARDRIGAGDRQGEVDAVATHEFEGVELVIEVGLDGRRIVLAPSGGEDRRAQLLVVVLDAGGRLDVGAREQHPAPGFHRRATVLRALLQ